MTTLLRNRNFALLWLAQFASGIGDVLYNVGVMVTIFQTTGSALQTAGVLVATTLPPFLLSPFAGAVVDRYSRRHVMIVMNLLRALLVGLLLLFVRPQNFNLWGIYATVTGLAAATAFYLPARLSIIPSLVVRRQLVRANSLIMSTNQATLAAGYVIGGVLILRVGFHRLVLLDLTTFLVAAALILTIRVDPDALRKKRAFALMTPTVPLWRAVSEGASYLRRHELARPLVVMEVLEHVPHGVWTAAIMLVFVQEALAGNAADWGYQNAAFFSGQLVGAIFATLVARRLAHRPGWMIIGNACLFGLLTIIYALSPTNLFAVVVAFVFGPPSAMRDIAQDSLLQASVAGEVMGRVYALRNMLTNFNIMLSGVAFAWLADLVPIRWIYVLAGVLYLGTAAYALSSLALRRSHIESQLSVSSGQ